MDGRHDVRDLDPDPLPAGAGMHNQAQSLVPVALDTSWYRRLWRCCPRSDPFFAAVLPTVCGCCDPEFTEPRTANANTRTMHRHVWCTKQSHALNKQNIRSQILNDYAFLGLILGSSRGVRPPSGPFSQFQCVPCSSDSVAVINRVFGSGPKSPI